MVSLSEQLVPLMAAAATAYGEDVLVTARGVDTDSPAAVGRRLLREIFGAGDAGARLPAPLADLIVDPQDVEARAALQEHLHDLLYDDPGLEAATVQALTGFYRQEIEAGNTEAMVMQLDTQPSGSPRAHCRSSI